MANTVIQIKGSGVTGNVPQSLLPGELAINYVDGKLFYGDDTSTTQLFDVITEPTGLNGEIQFNDNGSFGADANLRYIDATKTLVTDNINILNAVATVNVEAEHVIVRDKLYVGSAPELATPLPNLISQFTGNSTTYVQVNLENIDGRGSADYVITADVGTDTTFFVDLGMQGSTLEQGTLKPLDGYLLVQGNTGQVGGNLILGTVSGTPGQEIRFVIGGYEEANVVLKITENGIDLLGNELVSATTQRIYDQANAAFAAANTKLSGTGDIVISGNVTANIFNVNTHIIFSSGEIQTTRASKMVTNTDWNNGLDINTLIPADIWYDDVENKLYVYTDFGGYYDFYDITPPA